LDEIERSYDGRNDDLSEEEAMELAVEAVREVRAEMAAERARAAEDPGTHE
jgi:20S proteasome alpha/beta subunit